jgi:hypothetical protein
MDSKIGKSNDLTKNRTISLEESFGFGCSALKKTQQIN